MFQDFWHESVDFHLSIYLDNYVLVTSIFVDSRHGSSFVMETLAQNHSNNRGSSKNKKLGFRRSGIIKHFLLGAT